MANTLLNRKLSRRGIIVYVISLICMFVVAFGWEECLRVGTYNTEIHFDKPFAPAIAAADRIVVRASGFDCCAPVDETNILFVVTQREEIKAVADHFRFEPKTTKDSLIEACMCCGGPGIDWYRGKTRIVFTAIQHGKAIRWRGFSTLRIMGFRTGYGDGPLTKESQEWLKAWLNSHGIVEKEEGWVPGSPLAN